MAQNLRLFEPFDEVYLFEAGLITPVADGKRKIAASLFFMQYRSSALKQVSFGSSDPLSMLDVPTLEVPEILDSRATLEIIGFTPQLAAEKWQRWNGIFDSFGGAPSITFLDSALGRIEICLEDAEGGLADWDGWLSFNGLSDRVKAAIMDEEYRNIRPTAFARY
ncbi:MAG: hypothetical protein Q9218_005615 [Villophora microphyllina]